MKRCPHCNRVETEAALKFCRVDETTLVSDSSGPGDEAGTGQLAGDPRDTIDIASSVLPNTLRSS
jgi:hypothetical protein